MLSCRRWLLTRCRLSAGLLGRILPQPCMVHKMLVAQPGTAHTNGWMSSQWRWGLGAAAPQPGSRGLPRARGSGAFPRGQLLLIILSVATCMSKHSQKCLRTFQLGPPVYGHLSDFASHWFEFLWRSHLTGNEHL